MKINVFGFLLGAILVMSMASCAKDPVEKQDGEFSLSVQLPTESQTKTHLGNKGATLEDVYDILWSTGDKVSVNGLLSNAVASACVGTSKADFTFGTAPTAPYFVLYPAQSGESYKIALPSSQTYVAGSYDPAAAPMYGSSADDSPVQLHNLTGTIRFALNGSSKLTKIELVANGGESIAGTVNLSHNADSFTGGFNVTGGSDLITLSFGTGLQLSGTDTHVHIPVLAQAYSAGFTARVYNSDNDYMQLKFWGAGKTVSGTELYEFESKTYVAGRVEVLEGISPLTTQDRNFDTYITVGAYNIWSTSMRDKYYNARYDSSSEYYSGSGDGYMIDNDPRLWDTAKTHIASTIVACGYDVFGLAEVTDVSKAEIPNLVSVAGGNYTWLWYNTGQTDDSNPDLNGGEWHAIAYNPNIFTAGTKGKFWLHTGNNGRSPNKGAFWITGVGLREEGVYRTLDYVFLTHKVTGRTILFMHCHAPLDDDINTWAGDVIKYRIIGQGSSSGSGTEYYPINTENHPCVLAGDLNASPSEGLIYNKFSAFWTNAYADAAAGDVLSSGEIENPGTWANWRMQKSMLQDETKRIDHIFYSGDFTITNYWANRYRYNAAYSPASSGFRNFYPSDHMPVVAELSL
jgi:hypothetical protein